MTAIFIIDTNVVVAGLLTGHADSPVAQVFDGMLQASFRFAMSEALLAEYRSVLVRPKLMKLHQLAEQEVDSILTELTQHAIVLPLPSLLNTQVAPDTGDQFLWDLLASSVELMLVTGDKLLLQAGPLQAQVITPQNFVAQKRDW